jgi:hypothetical protein
MSKDSEIGSDEASKIIKKYAEKQKVDVKLTEEQLQTIIDQLKGKDPKMPTQVSFYVGNREVANTMVAGYWYAGDTCCV